MWDATISGADSIEVNYAKIHASHGGMRLFKGFIFPSFTKNPRIPRGGCDMGILYTYGSYIGKIHASHGGDATAKYSVCSCKKAIVRTNILYFFSSNQIG